MVSGFGGVVHFHFLIGGSLDAQSSTDFSDGCGVAGSIALAACGDAPTAPKGMTANKDIIHVTQIDCSWYYAYNLADFDDGHLVVSISEGGWVGEVVRLGAGMSNPTNGWTTSNYAISECFDNSYDYDFDECRDTGYNCPITVFPIPSVIVDGNSWGTGGSSDPAVYMPGLRISVPICNFEIVSADSLGQFDIDWQKHCNKKFTDRQKDVIKAAEDNYRRPAEEFTDDVARQECDSMFTLLHKALARNDSVFGMGAEDTKHGGGTTLLPIPPQNLRWAHVDPRFFRDIFYGKGNSYRAPGFSAAVTLAYQQVLATSIHEVFHMYNATANHYINDNNPSLGQEEAPNYTKPYFKRTNSLGGPNQCVR